MLLGGQAASQAHAQLQHVCRQAGRAAGRWASAPRPRPRLFPCGRTDNRRPVPHGDIAATAHHRGPVHGPGRKFPSGPPLAALLCCPSGSTAAPCRSRGPLARALCRLVPAASAPLQASAHAAARGCCSHSPQRLPTTPQVRPPPQPPNPSSTTQHSTARPARPPPFGSAPFHLPDAPCQAHPACNMQVWAIRDVNHVTRAWARRHPPSIISRPPPPACNCDCDRGELMMHFQSQACLCAMGLVHDYASQATTTRCPCLAGGGPCRPRPPCACPAPSPLQPARWRRPATGPRAAGALARLARQHTPLPASPAHRRGRAQS